ncbi:FkbM family methyltransferase [Halorubrum vacuolatum]|uniref:Methyltransferase, FkbM family n=1 Tax=Halorubrum vacuolatum TaxID=63740 RepID=A0A238XQ38_HALVU|nr:FkbM family methyltransferase [Halorubrum vacuolatum]SNR61067.1 methyltransferase, FkbM family [Halorubrum vacuolatum]
MTEGEKSSTETLHEDIRELIYNNSDSIGMRYSTVDVEGSTLLVDLNDPGISRDIWIHGTREPITTRAYQNQLEDVSNEVENVNVVDIGSNIGYYAFQPIAKLEDDVNVIAIEPDRANFALLKSSVLLNGYEQQVLPILGAVGDSEEERPMYVSNHSNLHSFKETHKNREKTVDTKNMVVHPLEDYLDESGFDATDINVVRMDVEGYEYEVLRGAKDIFNLDQPFLIQLEIHPGFLEEEQTRFIIDFLKENGFEIVSSAQKDEPLHLDSLDQIADHYFSELVLRR